MQKGTVEIFGGFFFILKNIFVTENRQNLETKYSKTREKSSSISNVAHELTESTYNWVVKCDPPQVELFVSDSFWKYPDFILFNIKFNKIWSIFKISKFRDLLLFFIFIDFHILNVFSSKNVFFGDVTSNFSKDFIYI